MLEVAKHVILANFFWLSLPFVGWALLEIAEKYIRNQTVANVIKWVRLQHIFLVFLISFAVTVFLFTAISLILYLLSAPVVIPVVIYFVLLAVAGVWFSTKVIKNLFSTQRFELFNFATQPLIVKFTFVLFCLMLVVDYGVSLYVGSYAQVSADTYVHLSRIVSIIHQGFTEQSGFFSGIAESGYHYNALYALHATGAQVTHLQPYELWQYSFGFFRLIQWLTIFVLANFILRNWMKSVKYPILWSTLAAILAMGIYSAYFYTAIYPNQLVHVWMIFIVLAMSVYEYGRKEVAPVVVALAFMITMIHPAYAFMTAMFIGLVFLAHLIREGRAVIIKKHLLLTYGLAMVVLMLGPIKTLLFPNRMSSEQVEIGAFPTLDFLGMSMRDPLFGLPSTVAGWALLLLSIVGGGYLLMRLWRQKRQFALVFSLLSFYLIIMYFPPIFTFVHAVLPLWVMDRFSAMNILVHVQVFIGIYAIFLGVTYAIKTFKKSKIQKILNSDAITAFFAVVVLLTAGYFGYDSYKALADNRQGNAHYYSFMGNTYDNLKNNLNSEKLVVATQGDSYFLSAILPIDVIAVEPGHMTPVTSVNDRIKCQSYLLETLDQASLKEIGASLIVLAKYEKNVALTKAKADSMPYLKLVNEDANFYVYEIDTNKLDTLNYSTQPSAACHNYREVEAR